jgi:5-hydroxyisourate hydrolase
MTVSTHVLDTARGRPATSLSVTLSLRRSDGVWAAVGHAVTDSDGRIQDLAAGSPAAGVYRLDFDTARYFEDLGITGFYPVVSVVFTRLDPGDHIHVPLLLSPFGYTTYRGT